jgi:hypothetical protein
MKRLETEVTLALCTMVCALGMAGCEEKSPRVIQPVTQRISANPTPEEKFNYIVATFRRGVEESNIYFRVPREGGHSMLAGHNEVTHELVKPTKEGEPYRGIITVVSQSHYSIQRSTDRPEDSPREEEAYNQDSESPLGDLNSADGIGILDSDLARSESSGAGAQPNAVTSESTVARRKDQTDRKYELEYHNGRWTLLTKLDPETEQGIQYAFDHALKTQI